MLFLTIRAHSFHINYSGRKVILHLIFFLNMLNYLNYFIFCNKEKFYKSKMIKEKGEK